jgi:hypothetical protein
MPFFKYVLLAILGSAGAAAPAVTPGEPSPRTLTAEAITQPTGGTEGLFGQATGGSPGKQAGTGRKGRVHTRSRRGHRRHHRTDKDPKLDTGKKPLEKH